MLFFFFLKMILRLLHFLLFLLPIFLKLCKKNKFIIKITSTFVNMSYDCRKKRNTLCTKINVTNLLFQTVNQTSLYDVHRSRRQCEIKIVKLCLIKTFSILSSILCHFSSQVFFFLCTHERDGRLVVVIKRLLVSNIQYSRL